MKISDLRTSRIGDRARVAATVTWEDCGRHGHEVYFETDEKFHESLTCNPHAFLVGCTIPAMHFGEKRVQIDAEICPELLHGLEIAMGWLRQWFYKSEDGRVKIEARKLAHPSNGYKPARSGIFFSGGIDSFAALRSNMLHYPPEHPRSIKDGLLVFGLEQDDPELFKYVLGSLSKVADAAGITLIPVYTNLYLHYRQEDAKDHFRFWGDEFGGAALAAVAHAFARRFTSVSIAATYSPQNMEPWGSHPLLDPNYGSYDLQILHDGVELSRLEKIKLVADWDVALKSLRVCNKYKKYRPGMLNCGRCEKCVRTMLALEALGALHKTDAFPRQDISPELVMKSGEIRRPEYEAFLRPIYGELLEPLAAVGRQDLVKAIEYILTHKRAPSFRERVREFDKKYLHKTLAKGKRFFSHRKPRRNIDGPKQRIPDVSMIKDVNADKSQ